MKEISAGGVVYKREGQKIKVLLIEDRYHKITIPKGKQEPGETLAETALREIKEETGIEGQLIQLLDKVHYQYNGAERGLIHKEVTYYLVESSGGQLSVQEEEINQAFWAELEEAHDLHKKKGYGNNDTIIEQAYRYLKQNVNLAGMIDHTLLKPEATNQEIINLCQEAKEHQFASVCVHPVWVKLCAEELQDTQVKVCTVIGFPLGANTTEVKAMETKQAIADGATEVDMVINLGALKSGDDGLVLRDIAAVVEAARGQALVKVIIETALLTEAEKIRVCQISKQAGADFVKTSTGFARGGATVEDIALMRKTVGAELGVKASGGIRDRETCLKLLEAGATRFGSSSGVSIVSQR